ncbi:MAG TPA: hypothetical protein VKX49_09330 [Bryobacteraceae bacterium]|nr:hypothetical protein [Bryobacteraceae bacterium]
MNAHDIEPGVIYRDEKVTVTGFPTQHAMESYGHRFDTPDHAWISSWPSVAPSGSQPVVLTTGEFHSSADVLKKEIGSRYSGTSSSGKISTCTDRSTETHA